MHLQTLQAFMTIFLLMMGSPFLAMDITGSHKAPKTQGERLSPVVCGYNVHEPDAIYRAVANGLHSLKILELLGLNKDLLRVIPKIGDYLPFNPPYYYFPIFNPNKKGKQEDLVIFTTDGKLAKVIFQLRRLDGEFDLISKQTYKDCFLDSLRLEIGRRRLSMKGKLRISSE